MNPPTHDERADYFEAVAAKLEDWDAYLEFLGTKLEEPRKPRVTKSGVRPAMGSVPDGAASKTG